jgi:hypothetical protein
MKFESKKQMAQLLMEGKQFKDNSGIVIHYNEKLDPPFRYDEDMMFGIWEAYHEDIWTEVESHNTHQDLIDSYQKGQAWQVDFGEGFKNLTDADENWSIPIWDSQNNYRLHPHNTLIQAHLNGAKIQAYICGDWIEEPNPDWYDDTQYRVKPYIEPVHEWMFKAKFGNKWQLEDLIMSEEEAKDYFGELTYRKTGRSWEK